MTSIREPDMLAAVREQLRLLGYEGDLLQTEYPFRDFLTARPRSASSVEHIQIATFAQSPPSYRSACIGVTTPDDNSPEAIAPYRALGAPQVLALHPRQGYIERWMMSATDKPHSLGVFTYGQIADTFRLYHELWGPQRILDAKTLSLASGVAQPDFFDAGFLPALEASLRPKLERDIQQVMKRCRDVYARQNLALPFDAVLDLVFRLVFRFIAAKMLIDRVYKPEWKELSASEVITAVDAFYFRNETPEPVLQDAAVQKAVWQQIRTGLDLQNLSVETLAYLYENAFVTEKLRRDQSIHATPPEVAEYMIRQLPLDKLTVDERRVFEPFTGHAPFLTAALRRLRELLPKDISHQERHDYFVRMLSGMENEPFAREIARYALILADYPNPDSWRISGENVFTDPEFDRLLREANIVLCNPPYGDLSPQERSTIGSEAAYTREAEALRRVLAHRPAMLGFVLPRSFLDRGEFRLLRLDVAAHYKNVSVTVLPDKTFNKASQEVALLTAHNIDLPSAPYSYADVPSSALETFKRTGEPAWKDTYTTLVRRNNDVVLTRTPLQSVWQALVNYSTFRKMADVHVGVHYKTGLLEECVSDVPLPDFVPGISTVQRPNQSDHQDAQNYMEAYLICAYQYLCKKPDVMRDNAYKRPWDQPKVLVNRGRRSRGYWHIAGAIDEQGLWALRQFYGMWPKNGTPIELLSALISGPVANAYLFSYPALRDNQARWIKQIPVPSFTEEQTELVVSLVQDYCSQRGQWLVTEHLAEHFEAKCLELLFQIDAAVLEAYALPADLERGLLRAFDGAERRPLPFDFPGYGAEYEQAKQKLQTEKVHRAVLKRYHTLVDKKYMDGLTAEEAEAMERLGQEIDNDNAPFYEPTIAALEAGKL